MVDSNPDFTTSVTPQAGTTVNGLTTAPVVSGSPPITWTWAMVTTPSPSPTSISKALDTLGGKGNDAILAVKGTAANVFGHLTIDAGDGNDLILLSGNNGVASNLDIDSGGGSMSSA